MHSQSNLKYNYILRDRPNSEHNIPKLNSSLNSISNPRSPTASRNEEVRQFSGEDHRRETEPGTISLHSSCVYPYSTGRWRSSGTVVICETQGNVLFSSLKFIVFIQYLVLPGGHQQGLFNYFSIFTELVKYCPLRNTFLHIQVVFGR